MQSELLFIIFAANICSLFMSPNLKRPRKILSPPPVKGFKPYGPDLDGKPAEPVMLLFEEYEALRLCDYDMLNHHHASQAMGVSRPTFTRIYASVRQKIARAFVEGRQITVEGGKVYFDSGWYHCSSCSCYFNNPEMQQAVTACPLCGSDAIGKAEGEPVSAFEIADTNDLCVCPACGLELLHQPGQPCGQQTCPSCHTRMRRKGTPGCRMP